MAIVIWIKLGIFLCLPYISLQQNIGGDDIVFNYNNTYKYNVLYTVDVDKYTEYIMEFAGDRGYADGDFDSPARVTVASDFANRTYPLFITARQQKGVFSWQLPMLVQTPVTVAQFTNISRTLCPHNNLFAEDEDTCDVSSLNTPIVHLTSSSPVPIKVTIKVEIVQDFYIKLNSTTNLTSTPSQPKYYFYPFEQHKNKLVDLNAQSLKRKHRCNEELNDSEQSKLKSYFEEMNLYKQSGWMARPKSVILMIESDDDICAVVSIQNFSCPVFDNERDILYDGYYLTMTRRGGITLTQDAFPLGFYIVFIVKTSDEACSDSVVNGTVAPTMAQYFGWSERQTVEVASDGRIKTFSFRIIETISYQEYIIAAAVALAFFLSFYVAFVISIVCERKRRRDVPVEEANLISRVETVETVESTARRRRPAAMDGSGSSHARVGINDDGRGRGDGSSSSDTESDISTVGTEDGPDKDLYRNSGKLCVASLARCRPRVLQARSKMYLWNVLTVGVFYTLPVIQLVVTYQKMLNQSGNQDLCYFNFLCAHPLMVLSDFNHVYSNLGYVLLGGLFLCRVWWTHNLHRRKTDAEVGGHLELSYFNHVYSNLGYVLLGGLFLCRVWWTHNLHRRKTDAEVGGHLELSYFNHVYSNLGYVLLGGLFLCRVWWTHNLHRRKTDAEVGGHLELSYFNHVYSNLGYVLLGGLFLCRVWWTHNLHRRKTDAEVGGHLELSYFNHVYSNLGYVLLGGLFLCRVWWTHNLHRRKTDAEVGGHLELSYFNHVYSNLGYVLLGGLFLCRVWWTHNLHRRKTDAEVGGHLELSYFNHVYSNLGYVLLGGLFLCRVWWTHNLHRRKTDAEVGGHLELSYFNHVYSNLGYVLLGGLFLCRVWWAHNLHRRKTDAEVGGHLELSYFNHVYSNLGYVLLGGLFLCRVWWAHNLHRRKTDAEVGGHLELSYFNHVYSNLGYVLLGGLFLCRVWWTHNLHRRKTDAEKELGIPQHFGLLYAMGVALVSEGALSAAYHVCPNSMNFQFDTSFMYVTSVLCMVKIYQCRHPDINARAHATFAVLALIIFIGLVGVLNANFYFWIMFTALHLITCLVMTFQIYYLGRFRLDVGTVYRAGRELVTRPLAAITPTYVGRCVLLLIANLANWAIAAYGVSQHSRDFASHLLLVLMSNLFLYTLFYIVMKLLHRESIRWYSWVYIALTYTVWFSSSYFYLDQSTNWALTPAQSRRSNRVCSLLQLYDSHDVWHFMSAIAMFFSFNMYLTIDDNLSDVPRSNIMVF